MIKPAENKDPNPFTVKIPEGKIQWEETANGIVRRIITLQPGEFTILIQSKVRCEYEIYLKNKKYKLDLLTEPGGEKIIGTLQPLGMDILDSPHWSKTKFNWDPNDNLLGNTLEVTFWPEVKKVYRQSRGVGLKGKSEFELEEVNWGPINRGTPIKFIIQLV